MEKGDGRMFYSVESGGFHHGVMRHVIEHQNVSRTELAGKCVVADDVASKAGRATEAVG